MVSSPDPSITYAKSIVQLDYYGKCDECGKSFSDFHWCPTCQNQAFKREFRRWTSGNISIDQIIQQTQLEANRSNDYLEWIPFENFEEIKYLSQGAFSTIYSGYWVDGPRRNWIEDDWFRDGPTKCVLKRIENSQQISQYYLDNHIRCLRGGPLADYFGISRDPTGCYMFIMKFYERNLYQYLDEKLEILRWRNMIEILLRVADGLERIHENELYHGNLHGGNLLFEDNPEFIIARIADIGLHGPANRTASDIYGVLPYVAPEILDGNEYTQASDIYSFGIIITSTISIQFNIAEEKRKLNSKHIIFRHRAIHPKAIYTSQLLDFNNSK
ncbi:2626_t:CDS:2 [Racocetra fulgida]|uniref:2626_t:CDS:1 n=1 Tax=Racocetra fulgida TaxID=60492 RepID=A0A9N8ZKK3_9GLOM|nr:2626_t:CDS:2 [Racocetra fulgida]